MIEKGLGKNGRRQFKSEEKDLGMMISSISLGLFFYFQVPFFFFFFSSPFFLRRCPFGPVANTNAPLPPSPPPQRYFVL